jgi:hypothetical protein
MSSCMFRSFISLQCPCRLRRAKETQELLESFPASTGNIYATAQKLLILQDVHL